MAISSSFLALALTAGGAATNAVGQIKAGNAAERAGKAAQDAAESQAQLAEYNAAVEDLRSKDAIERGAEDEQRFRTSIRAAIGTQRAGFAANNIDVGFGSAVDVQGDAAKLGELDALTIRTNAAREAWGYQVSAQDYRRQAEITRKEGAAALQAGKVQKTTSRINTASSLLGTSGMLLERYGFGKNK